MEDSSPENTDTGTNRGALARELFPSDIQAMIRGVQRGFPMSADDMAACVVTCRQIMDDPKSARRTRLIAAKGLAVFAAHNLRDLHHTERLQHESGILDLRMRRAEEGKPNDCVAVQVTPVRELPLPDSMRAMRKRLLEPSES